MSERETVQWPVGVATGVGSLPGDQARAAARLVFDLFPDFPHVPELPGRGPGADVIGRTAALLPGLSVDLQPAGWRFVDHPGRDMARGRSYLSEDLDAIEEVGEGYSGLLKLQLCGPWTLAASIELPRGNRALRDRGAVRDVVASLAQGAAEHVRELGRRLPRAQLIVQWDEPSLPAVLDGRLRTASGFGMLDPVEEQVVEEGLHAVLTAVGVPSMVHCCAPMPPVALIRRVGAAAFSLDLALARDDDESGDALEAGLALFAGAVPSIGSVRRDGPILSDATDSVPRGQLAGSAAGVVRDWWRRIGLPVDRLPTSVVLTPTCGLAGASPMYAKEAMVACSQAALRLRDDPEGGR